MQYQIPQFIDIEDKIFGPLTAKQFLYVSGGVAIVFLIWSLPIPRFFAIILAAPFLGLSIALAFQKVNNRPFVSVLESSFNYLFNKKLYVWRKTPKKIQNKDLFDFPKKNASANIPQMSQSKLKQIAWNLDINEKIKGSEPEKDSEKKLGLRI